MYYVIRYPVIKQPKLSFLLLLLAQGNELIIIFITSIWLFRHRWGIDRSLRRSAPPIHRGCSSVLMSVSSKKSHTIWMHVGFAFESKCVCIWVWIREVHCSVDQSAAVISFKPFLSPFCSMAYSAFIWITSKTKLGKTEAGISQFSFYPPVFKNANIWHSK